MFMAARTSELASPSRLADAPAQDITRSKDASMQVHQESPYNSGPPLERLRERFVTPKELFFVRNHGDVPQIDPARYALSVGGLVQRDLSLSLAELQICFPRVSVPAAMVCAGIRRDELARVQPIPGELPWGAEPVGNAVWTGVRLRDVLERAEIAEGARHVCFAGLDEVQREGKRFAFGGSVPVEKAVTPEVLLAFEMNGEPLTPLHGAPLRVVVPGYIGARSVKWLSSIRLTAAPSDNYFQQKAYKTFAPDVSAATVQWDQGLTLYEHAVNSVICSPFDGQTLGGGEVLVRGFSFTGNGEAITRVELSRDDGSTWTVAELLDGASRWTWVFWQARLRLPRGEHRVLARAFDATGRTQPRDAASLWNLKGYLNNAWHSVRFRTAD
jgi:sulfite oxidase